MMGYGVAKKTDRLVDCIVRSPLYYTSSRSQVTYLMETKGYKLVYLYNGLYVCGGVIMDSMSGARSAVKKAMEHYGLNSDSPMEIGIVVTIYQYEASKCKVSADEVFLRQTGNVEKASYIVMPSEQRSDEEICTLIDAGEYGVWSEHGRGVRGCW